MNSMVHEEMIQKNLMSKFWILWKRLILNNKSCDLITKFIVYYKKNPNRGGMLLVTVTEGQVTKPHHGSMVQ